MNQNLKIQSVILLLLLLFQTKALLAQKEECHIVINVIEKNTGKAIHFAFVKVNGKKIGQTDSLGVFYFFLPRKREKVVVGAEAIGYTPSSDTLYCSGNVPEIIRLFLSPEPIGMKQVIVEAYQPFWGTVEGKMLLSPASIKTPQLWSGDLMRIIQSVPGASFRTDANSRIYLGGGDFYQTSVLWNGIPIFNPSHIGGLIGALPAIPGDSILVSSVAPTIKFGPGSLAGSVEMWTSFPKGWVFDSNPISGLLRMGFSHQTNQLEWRGRIVHYDLAGKLSKTAIPYTFGDVGLQFRKALTASSTIQFLSYSSLDKVNLEIHDWNQNGIWSARWSNLLAGLVYRIKMADADEITLSYSSSTAYVKGGKMPDRANINFSYINAGIGSKIRQKNILFNMKFSYNLLKAKYDWFLHNYSIWDIVYYPGDIFYDFAPLQQRYRHSFEYFSLFNSFQTHRGPFRFKLESRLDFEKELPRSPFFSGGINCEWNTPFGITDIKIGQRYQYYFALKQNSSMGFDDPFAANFIVDEGRKWVPLSRYAGFSHQKAFANFAMGMKGYLKSFKNIPLSDFQLKKMAWGKGLSYSLQVWANYSLKNFLVSAWVNGDEALFRRKEWYRASFSRRFQFHSFFKYRWRSKWLLSMSTFFLSGIPYTEYDYKFRGLEDLSRENLQEGSLVNTYFPGIGHFVNTASRAVASRAFSKRTPNYFRIDLGLEFLFYQSKTRKGIFYFRVFNLTNRRNVTGYLWHPDEMESKRQGIRGLPFIPMLGIRLEPR